MKAVSLQGLSEKDREDTLNEAKLMKQLKHENLIRCSSSQAQQPSGTPRLALCSHLPFPHT